MTGQRQPAKVHPFIARFAESEFLGQCSAAGELQGPDPAVLGPVSLNTLTCHVPYPLKPRGLRGLQGARRHGTGSDPPIEEGTSGAECAVHGITCTRVTTMALHTRLIASEVLLYSKTKLISLNIFYPTRYVSGGSEKNEMLVTRNRVWQCRDQTLETKVSETYDNHLHTTQSIRGKPSENPG